MQIVVIGAGFCGTMIACELARLSTPHELAIALVDDRAQFARGVAYQCNDEGWLLNAHAAQLGAVNGRPDDFSRFCQSMGIDTADCYVPRALYGAYLEDLLDRTASSTLPHRLYRVYDRAVAIERAAGGAVVTLENGKAIQADHVILATGPASPSKQAMPQLQALGDRYLPNPWHVQQLYDASPGSTFGILGTGLTALDVVTSLQRRVPHAKFRLLSRRGLMPRPHASGLKRPPSPELIQTLQAQVRGDVRQCLAALRRVAAWHQDCGGDWRAVIDALRPLVPKIWAGWPHQDKIRFMTHVAPYWETHRHRCPTNTAEMIERLQGEGRLHAEAGRLRKVHVGSAELQLEVQFRHAEHSTRLPVHYLVNCTGPTGGESESSLIARLRQSGLASTDAFGLRIDDAYHLIGHDGTAFEALSYVGPLLKGKYWEATAIPELREHVVKLTASLAQRLFEQESVQFA